jgi:hypothetical protein
MSYFRRSVTSNLGNLEVADLRKYAHYIAIFLKQY